MQTIQENLQTLEQPSKDYEEIKIMAKTTTKNKVEEMSKTIINKVDETFNIVQQNMSRIQRDASAAHDENLLSKLYPTGFVEIDGITCLSVEGNSKYFHDSPNFKTVAGDKYGFIHLIDLTKKIVCDKAEAFHLKRINSIATSCAFWWDTHICKVVVIARADPNIKVFNYKNRENKLVLQFTIKTENPIPQPDTLIDHYPLEAFISADSCFLAITTYEGETHFLRAPEFPEPKISETETVKKECKTGKVTEEPKFNTTLDKFPQLEIEIKDLVLFTVPSFVPPVDKKKEVIEEEETKVKEEKKKGKEEKKKGSKKEEKKKESKKQDAKKSEAKKNAKAGKKEQVKEEEALPEKRKIVFGDLTSDDKLGDNSRLTGNPEFPVTVIFVSSSFDHLDDLGSSKINLKSHYTLSAYLIYYNTFYSQEYILQAPPLLIGPKDYSHENYMQMILKQAPKQPQKKEKKALFDLISNFKNDNPIPETEIKKEEEENIEGEEIPPYIKKKGKTLTTGSPISTINSLDRGDKGLILALGLVNGSVIIYDISLGAIINVLQTHTKEVTAIKILDENEIALGFIDGTVKLINYNGIAETLFSFPNCLQNLSSIVWIGSYEIGVLYAIDIFSEFRMFDLHRKKKIAQLSLSEKLSNITSKLVLLPQFALQMNKDIVVGLIEEKEIFSDATMITEKELIYSLGVNASYLNLRKIEQEKKLHFPKRRLFLFRQEEILISLYPVISQYMKQKIPISSIFKSQDLESPYKAQKSSNNQFLLNETGPMIRSDISSIVNSQANSMQGNFNK